MILADDIVVCCVKVHYIGRTEFVGQIESPVPKSFESLTLYKLKLWHILKDYEHKYEFVSGFFKRGKYYINYKLKSEDDYEDFSRLIYDGMKLFENGCSC